MKWVSAVILAAACSAAACRPAPAQAVNGPEGKRMHVETTFEVLVHATYAEAAELFSPEGERAWAGEHWDPQFLYPIPAQDKQGAVFTISHGLVHAVWVVSQHDLEARHFQYVYFIPELLVTTIDVRFQSLDSKATLVTVTYARTGISPDGDEHAKSMSDGDQAAGRDWQEAIDQYLKSRAAPPAR